MPIRRADMLDKLRGLEAAQDRAADLPLIQIEVPGKGRVSFESITIRELEAATHALARKRAGQTAGRFPRGAAPIAARVTRTLAITVVALSIAGCGDDPSRIELVIDEGETIHFRVFNGGAGLAGGRFSIDGERIDDERSDSMDIEFPGTEPGTFPCTPASPPAPETAVLRFVRDGSQYFEAWTRYRDSSGTPLDVPETHGECSIHVERYGGDGGRVAGRFDGRLEHCPVVLGTGCAEPVVDVIVRGTFDVVRADR